MKKSKTLLAIACFFVIKSLSAECVPTVFEEFFHVTDEEIMSYEKWASRNGRHALGRPFRVFTNAVFLSVKDGGVSFVSNIVMETDLEIGQTEALSCAKAIADSFADLMKASYGGVDFTESKTQCGVKLLCDDVDGNGSSCLVEMRAEQGNRAQIRCVLMDRHVEYNRQQCEMRNGALEKSQIIREAMEHEVIGPFRFVNAQQREVVQRLERACNERLMKTVGVRLDWEASFRRQMTYSFSISATNILSAINLAVREIGASVSFENGRVLITTRTSAK